MRRLLFGVLLAGLTVPVFAYDDWDRDDRYDGDRGNHRGWYKHDRDDRDYRTPVPIGMTLMTITAIGIMAGAETIHMGTTTLTVIPDVMAVHP